MSYSKTAWKTGDTITAQLLNHAEDGIAANDAAIAAIPAGLQLYGPYNAHAAADISANSGEDINLTNIEDINGVSVTLPDDDAVILFTSARITAAFFGTMLVVQGMEAPVKGVSWAPAHIVVVNGTDSAQAVTASMTLYSTVEFPQES